MEPCSDMLILDAEMDREYFTRSHKYGEEVSFCVGCFLLCKNMNVDKYRMNGIDFVGDGWEFVYSLVYLKYNKRINILQLGDGNYSLLYALCNEYSDRIKKILSVDAKNLYEQGHPIFYQKKRLFSALANRNYEYVQHFQGDCFAEDIVATARSIFTDNPIDMLVIEYMKNDEYMNKIFDTYEFYFSQNVDIYYHDLYKSEESLKYFLNLSKDKKSAILNAGVGIGVGIVKNVE